MAKPKAEKFVTSQEVMTSIKENGDNIQYYIFVGPEDYLIDAAVNAIKKKYITPGSESTDYVKMDIDIQPSDDDSKRVRGGKNTEFIKSLDVNIHAPAWLSPYKLIYVSNSKIADFNDEDSQLFSQVMDNIPESTIVIFREKMKPGQDDYETKKNLDALIKKIGSVLPTTKSVGVRGRFDYMDEAKISAWISRNLGKSGIQINEEAVTSLIARCESRLQSISNEMDKLKMYCGGMNINFIDYNVIEECCPPDVTASVFKITDCIGSGSPAEALITLNNLISAKTKVVTIRARLTKHLKLLICAKEIRNKDELAKKLGIHSYTASKAISQASRFSVESLLKLYMLCNKGEFDVRKGYSDERQSIEAFIVTASQIR